MPQCPNVDYNKQTRFIPMTMMHVNGLHSTRVAFCRCGTTHPDHVEQLVAVRLFPATVDIPETAFTFECLDDFQIQSLTSKKLAHDYVWAKRRQTNPLSPYTVKVQVSNGASQQLLYICKIRDIWAEKYRHARECLLVLGADPAHYRQLNDNNMYLRNICDHAALGEGSTTLGWIWSVRWHWDETPADTEAHQLESTLFYDIFLYCPQQDVSRLPC